MRTYSFVCEHARYPLLRATVLVVHGVLALFLRDWSSCTQQTFVALIVATVGPSQTS